MSLSDAAYRLQHLLGDHAAVIGGVCGAIHGVERFTRDVDFACDMSAETIIEELRAAGLKATVRRSGEPKDLPWVVSGTTDDVPFQILPAAAVGIDITDTSLRSGLRVPHVEAFMRSKCIAGGQQDLHDVAVLCLQQPDREASARQLAVEHGVLDKLEAWLDDRRLRQRHAADESEET